jgi:uncharacterized membrane protein YfcA
VRASLVLTQEDKFMKHALLLLLLGLAGIAVATLVDQLLGDTIGTLVFVAFCIAVFFYERRRVRQQRQAEQIRTVRSCPFCRQGTLSIDPGSRITHRRGRAFYMWKCSSCNYWAVAGLLGNLPEQEQGE